MKVHVIDLRFMGKPHAIAAYLLEGPEGWVLIETGPESTRPTLVRGIQEQGIEPEDLAGVLVTHIHLDHAGAAGWFSKRGVPVYAHPKAVKHIIDPSKLVDSARHVYGSQFDLLWGHTVPGKESNVHAVEDGETVHVGGIPIEAMSTPGHAFHHHAYFIGNAAFVGDTAGARISKEEYTSVTSAPPQFHLESYLESIDKLLNRSITSLFLTHFGRVDYPREHLKAYREAVELNALFVRQRVEEGMDEESLRIAYQAFQFEQAFRYNLPREVWDTLETINGTDMCADGMRLYWEKRLEEGT